MTISKVALYARVSRADNDQDPDNQLIKLREFAHTRGFEVVAEYVDHASGALPSRPQLDRMLADARGHRFNAIIAVKIDRIGRSALNLLGMLEELDRLRVGLICTDQSFDTTGPEGKLLFTVLSGVAEFERELIRERTRDGLARAKAQGKRIGRPPLAVSTEEIIALKAQGMSLREIGERVGMSHQGVKKRLRQSVATKRVEIRK
jgi:DNA invertase Pin-like site-specific DNA recombinase